MTYECIGGPLCGKSFPIDKPPLNYILSNNKKKFLYSTYAEALFKKASERKPS